MHEYIFTLRFVTTEALSETALECMKQGFKEEFPPEEGIIAATMDISHKPLEVLYDAKPKS